MTLFQHHRGESSLKLFILCFVYLISVPNAFCRLIFKNHDLFKFAQNFHAMLTSRPFLFCASIDLSLNFEFSDVLSWMCSKRRTILVELRIYFAFEVKYFILIRRKELESILPLLASHSVAVKLFFILYPYRFVDDLVCWSRLPSSIK